MAYRWKELSQPDSIRWMCWKRAAENHMEEIRKLKEIQNVTLNKTAIVKYDAFKEMGGKLSFALAMLDQENNGFVMNAIHSREGCYT